MKEIINEILNKEESAILKGLLLGDTSNIKEDIYEKFQISNMAHILAVSGMHISYIVIGINFLLNKKLGKRKTKYAIIIILIFYMFITGFSPSIIRATTMGVLVTLSGILYRKNDMWTGISLSLLLILIYNPFLITNIGLQLSYLGTIGIIILHKNIYKIFNKIKIDKIREILAVTFSAQIGILPITLFHFNFIGIYFWIINLIVSIIIGPIIFIGVSCIILYIICMPIAKEMSFILEIFIKVLIQVANFSELPFSKIYITTPKIWMVILYYITIIIVNFSYSIYNKKRINITERRFRNLIELMKYKFKQKNNSNKLKKILLFVILISLLLHLIPKNLKIYFVDVGQGDCTFIVTPQNKTILVDGGGSEFGEFDVGKRTLLPYILDRGYKEIDYIIISHFDEDHVGGILTIIKELKVGQVIISKQGENSDNFQEFLEIVNKKRIKVQVVKKGDKINIEKHLNIEILWPQHKLIQENILNNNSIVFRLNYLNFSMLFTGDIEEIAEKEILKELNNNSLKADVLKIAHHGSKTSSIQGFLDKVTPKVALIGVGENNNFGHPNEAVITRLNNYGTKIYRTDEMGEIILHVNSNGQMIVRRKINI